MTIGHYGSNRSLGMERQAERNSGKKKQMISFHCKKCDSTWVQRIDVHCLEWDMELQVWIPLLTERTYTFGWCRSCSKKCKIIEKEVDTVEETDES